MKEALAPLDFPLAGLDVSQRFGRQPQRQVLDGVYARTTSVGVNVRAYDPTTGRLRGSSRPGLSRYVNAIPSGTAGQIQFLGIIVGAGYSPPGGTSQTSQSGRVVTLVTVIGGRVYICDAGGTSWTAATNGSSRTDYLNSTGVVRGTVAFGVMYLFDGSNIRTYTPSTNTVGDFVASNGYVPSNTAGTSFPKLCCTWRGRLVLSGLTSDAQNVFMSEQGDADDFNYSPSSTTPSQAVAGNVSLLGYIGDSVTGLAPFNDDVLVVFGDSSIWQIKGDPMQGGQAQRYTDGIGCVYGEAWCKDSYGTMYFMSNRGNIYAMAPNQQPIRISQSIDPLLETINTGTNVIRMAWVDREQALRVFVTPASAAAATTHYTWEQRTQSWWKDTFANNNFNPVTLTTFDGNTADDRVTIIGSWDGYVRAIDMAATDDDNTDIESSVVLGPITSETFDEMTIRDVQAILGESSDPVTYNVYVGNTPEEALSSTSVESGTFGAGRNPTTSIRRTGYSVHVKLSSTGQWSMEQLMMLVATRGKARRRAWR